MKNLKDIWENEVGKIFIDLSKIALADGTITADESSILESVRKDVDKFVKAYIKSIDDEKITEKETQQLKTLWNNIYDDAKKTANTDGVITADEKAMLIKIAESILEHKE